MTDIELYDDADGIERVPLQRGGRSDWRVPAGTEVVSFDETDIIARMRLFFDALDAEAERRQDEPVAMVNALARMEALLADVRYVRDTMHKYCATALHEQKIRRLTLEACATVEASSNADRTWHDKKLMTRLLSEFHVTDKNTGEVVEPDRMASHLLGFAAVTYWRMKQLKAAGLDPDEYSDIAKDEDGKIIRTPTVRMVDNLIRRVSGSKQ